eukprot:2212625-Alexandrium_andersonii.AAC.1
MKAAAYWVGEEEKEKEQHEDFMARNFEQPPIGQLQAHMVQACKKLQKLDSPKAPRSSLRAETPFVPDWSDTPKREGDDWHPGDSPKCIIQNSAGALDTAAKPVSGTGHE